MMDKRYHDLRSAEMIRYPPFQYGSIIQQGKKYSEDVKTPCWPYILNDEEVELVKQLIYDREDDYLAIKDISIYST